MLNFSVQDLMRVPRIQRTKLYKRLHGKPMWAVHPISLNLDTQNRKCNLDCYYCNPQHGFIKDHSELKLSELQILLETLKESKTFINFVCCFGNSDPLLESRLPTIAKMIKKDIGARVDVFTNGTIFGNRELLHTAYLDDIRFTISASNPELYQSIHGRPYFSEALKTLKWLSVNKFFHQRLWVNFILFEDNAHNLDSWKEMFRDYYQDIRPLHYGDSRNQSKRLANKNDILGYYRKRFTDMLIRTETPCSCFHGLAVSAYGDIMQCIDLPYEYNYGKIEEIDILETYQKKLDVGLNHPGCEGCNQKNPHWKELFEKYVW